MPLFIFGRIFKKKEAREEKEAEDLKEISQPREIYLKSTPLEREEKEFIKSELKPGPLTEKFFDLTPIREKKKEGEKE